MPAPTIRCEFCADHTMRQDAYAVHVKAKHMKEIALLLLDDFKENMVNTLQAYAKEQSVKAMPVYSKMYQDAEYWFGVKPHFYIRESVEVAHDPTRPDRKEKAYPEDEQLRQYLTREENLVAHRQYLEEVMRSISIMDFITYQKNIVVRNPDVTVMRTELHTLRDAHAALQKSSQQEIERLKKEVEVWKETAMEKDCIPDLRKEAERYRSACHTMERQMAQLKKNVQEREHEMDEQWASLNESRFAREREMDEQMEKLRKEIGEWKEKAENMKVKIKVEAQKIVDKEREAKQKVKEKKALEKEKAKKAAKKAAKLAALSDSDSDSDSD